MIFIGYGCCYYIFGDLNPVPEARRLRNGKE